MKPSGAAPYVEEALRWLDGNPATPAAEQAFRGDAGSSPSAFELAARGRILLVDDNADMRSYAAGLLRPRWDVQEIADGSAALEAARAQPPDLVTTDIMMPGLDGFELLRALRADPLTGDVPVIMLSARANAEARIDGVDAGADDYLVKPFTARELVARVNLQMTMRQARAAINKQRAELYETFMQAPVPICVLRGRDLTFEMANPLYCKFVGRAPAAVVGRPLAEVFPELVGQGFDEMLLEVMRSAAAKTVDEVLISLDLKGDGSLEETYWSFVYAPLRDVAGRVDRVLAVSNNTTEYVRTRKDLEFQRQRAESSGRAKDEFLAMLGHELRNPLAPILTALQLMALRGDDTHERAIIERQTKHLVRLVDDLFDVSRITRGQVTLNRERCEMSDIVSAGIEMASPLLEKRGHTLTVDVPQRSFLVEGDRSRLAQVVSNLLTNAAKYTERGGTIHVALRKTDGWLELSVRDSGIGITPSMLPLVFDLFSQERQTIDRAQGGLGLGLAIVRSLVRLHGGDVAAHSQGREAGSEFVVRLPVAAEVPSAQFDKPVPRDTKRARGLRILIVDDNDDAAEMLEMALSVRGHSVRTANDGTSALRVATEFSPEVGLLDIGLPVMDGYELASLLRADPKHARMRLIALTGYGQPADVAQARATGFDEHELKPISLERLETVIRGASAPD